jgi:hypothetical protein
VYVWGQFGKHSKILFHNKKYKLFF